MPKENRNQYSTVIGNRTRTLATLSPLTTHTNGTHGYELISHSTPENNMYGQNSCSAHNMHQRWQNRRHNNHTAPFRSSHTDHDK